MEKKTNEISFFEHFRSTVPIPCTLDALPPLIREDQNLKAITEAYRQTHDMPIKERSPLFAVACTFAGGKGRDNVRTLTGLSLVDIDHIDAAQEGDAEPPIEAARRKACADPHTLLCYTTISGQGLRIVFRYELDDSYSLSQQRLFYPKAFAAGNAYYERLLGLKADGQCKNLTRLSGLAHDPGVMYRADATPFGQDEIEAMAGKTRRRDKEQRQRERIQAFYDNTVRPQLEAEGIRYRPGSHNGYVMRVGYRIAERGFAKKPAMDWAKATFADYADTAQVFESCFAHASPHREATERTATAGVEDIKRFLDGHIRLRHNEITGRIEYTDPGGETWTPICDRTVNSLWTEMSQTTRIYSQDMYRVIESDYVPLFHPFREYLGSLPPYPVAGEAGPDAAGGTTPIGRLAASVRVRGDQALWTKHLAKWLVAMVASWIDRSVVNNVILVLIGEQGTYKTTWFSRLLPPQLRLYFHTKTNANRMTKDDLLTLAQYGLVCCEELDTMRPSELNQLKAAVTMPSVDERAAYAHYAEHRSHIASFCATGNNAQFLSDPTGNRRWLPFEVESIDSPWDHPLDYEGIYAQALALYRRGFKYWFDKGEIMEQNLHNRQFETPRLEQELVDLYFRKPTGNENGEFISAARALQAVGCNITQKLSAVNVGRAFADLGFKRVRTSSARGFIAVCRTAEEIKAYQHAMMMEAREE